MFTNEWIDAQCDIINVVECFSAIQGVYIDVCYDTDGLWKYPKGKRPVTKDHIVDDCICRKCPKQTYL